MKLTKINNKWDIWLPDHRADRKEWPTWEYKRLESMHKTTKPDDIVYYVGAEEGDMAGLLAMWGAKLLMFEPNDKVWPQIKAIFDANKVQPLGVFPGFASDITNYADLKGKPIHEWPDWVNGPIIAAHGFKELKDPDNIPQVRIDDVLTEITVPPPDMISLDVEGSEGRVLRGAEQTLRKYRPRIYLSLHPEFLRTYGEWGAELRKWIMDLGYKETLLDYPLHEVHLYYD